MSQSDFVTRGQALVTSGQYQEAVKVCRLGLLGRPTTVEGRLVLGQALLALKRYDEVLAEMRVALELDHTSVTAQLLKGEALLAKGDAPAAADVLGRVQPMVPADQERLGQLLAAVHRRPGRPQLSASHPAVGYVGGTGEAFTVPAEPTNESTKHYPNHSADEEDTEPRDEEEAGNYTRPTSISAPGSKQRSGRQQAMGEQADYVPPAAVLAVGDRSGTVEVDPEADGVELEPDDDFGEVVAPPSAGKTPARVEGARGSVKRSARARAGVDEPPTRRGRPMKNLAELSSVELDSDDMELIEEAPASAAPRRPGPGTAVRNAVMMPAGPLDRPGGPAFEQPFDPRPVNPAAVRPTQAQPVPPLAQMIAQQPHVMQVQAVPPQAVNPRSAIAAALPTAAAQPMPLPPAHMQPTISPHLGMAPPAASHPAMALTPAQQESAAAVDALFGAEPPPQPGPAWAKATVVAGAGNLPMRGPARSAADEPTRQPGELDPRIAADLGSNPAAAAFNDTPSSVSSGKPLKTGVRRGRSRLAVAMWFLVGGAVIGGGVFAGFQIRAMRLEKQIAAAHDQAVALAKSDTWQGWAGARDRLAGIARAASTVDNRAALARARGVLAYEFGDGLAEAKAALDKLGTEGGLDTAIGLSYLALAQSDPEAAKAAVERASAIAPDDAAVLYVAGQAALLAGDYKVAVANLRTSHERDPRPLYAVGLARAIGATGAWDDALAAVDRALGAMPDHPAALIERALLLARAGRIVAGNTITAEVRTQLVKLVDEGKRPPAEQTRGVSPAQVALANLALAQVDFALRDVPAALTALKAAADVGVEEQRFGEEATDTLYMFGELQRASGAAVVAVSTWPGSRRARTSQAQIALTLGKATEALDVLRRSPEAAALPRGQAVQGLAKLALGDVEGARADLDAALKTLPLLEVALIGRAWVALAQNDPAYAKKLIEPRYNATYANVAMTTVYASILRSSGDADKARQLLEKAVSGPQTVDVPRAQLELGRLLRDAGDMRGARAAFQEAIRVSPTMEARLENALLSIEDRDPTGGRDTIDQILDTEPNAMANPRIVLEGARARMLAGDHVGASQLLDVAEKLPSVSKWTLARERGRLHLRKGEVAKAATALGQALEGAGNDAETFLLAAELVTVDPKQTTALAKQIQSLVEARLKDLPEALIVKGKLALAAEDLTTAEASYVAAGKALGETASKRRLAQAYYGLAVIAYNKQDDPTAQMQLDLVIQADPSIYGAYLYAAEIAKSKASVAFDNAKKAVTFNPDSAYGWYMVGSIAAKLRKPKDLAQAIERLTQLAPGSPMLEELAGLKR